MRRADKFGWEESRLDALDTHITDFTLKVHPTQRLQVVKEDPDDDRVIECAVASASSFIISGDRHLLDLRQYRSISIIRVADFLGREPEVPRGR